MRNILKNKPYGNCIVKNIKGIHIFNCSKKRCAWYLKRNLATIVKANPLTIQLNFVSKGDGHMDEPYFLQDRKNICVVCGSSEKLTMHHILPFCYKRHMSEKFKSHNSYDILPLCYKCHGSYEIKANKFKDNLIIEYGVIKTQNFLDKTLKSVCLHAAALLKYGENIPYERRNDLMESIKKYYGREEISIDDLKNASTIEYHIKQKNEQKTDSQFVVEALIDIPAFIKRWRKHFIDSLAPKYMPEHWDIERI